MALAFIPKMTTHQMGYACMTMLIILAFIFLATCFSFNTWYRMDIGPFTIRTGLWEMRIYDETNITGLDLRHHQKAEFRFYNSIWKSAIDRMDEMANKKPPPKKQTVKPKGTTKAPLSRGREPFRASDGDVVISNDLFIDPDFYEYERFGPGEDWFTLPQYKPNSVWDQMQGSIDAAEALFSITWLLTFALMCLFAFHQFVPTFNVTVAIMRMFCAALFVTGFFALIAMLCYGHAMPPICSHLTNAYEKSPNPKLAEAARTSSDCSFGAGYAMSVFSALFLMATGIMAAVRICQLQRGETFDLGSAAGTAVSYGKSLIGGVVSTAAVSTNNYTAPEQQNATTFNWNEPPPSSAYSAGYDQQESYQSM